MSDRSCSVRSGVAGRALQTFDRWAAEERGTEVEGDAGRVRRSFAERLDLSPSGSSDFNDGADRSMQTDM